MTVKPDPIWLFSDTLVMVGRFVFNRIHLNKDSHPSKIMQNWKRNDVCVETKERGKDHVTREYPKLISKSWKGHNRVFKYSG